RRLEVVTRQGAPDSQHHVLHRVFRRGLISEQAPAEAIDMIAVAGQEQLEGGAELARAQPREDVGLVHSASWHGSVGVTHSFERIFQGHGRAGPYGLDTRRGVERLRGASPAVRAAPRVPM